jgi:RNA polymerase sigma-70 factor, ECF subfamily
MAALSEVSPRAGDALAGQCVLTLFSRPQTRVEDFEAAAMPHLAALYRTAKFLVHEPSEAEDLVQEVYLEAWKSFHRFEPGTNCRAWLFSILFHRLHHLRRHQLRSSKVESFSDPAEADALPATPPVPQDLRDEDILQALGKLPHDFREVVLLADVQEFSYKEVAETLGIPLGTVMSRLSRGRKLLRHELAHVARSYGIRGANEGESA